MMKFPNEQQLSKDLHKLNEDNFQIICEISPANLWIIIFTAQIGLQHPSNVGNIPQYAREVLKQLQTSLDVVPSYTQTLKQALDYRWHSIDKMCEKPPDEAT